MNDHPIEMPFYKKLFHRFHELPDNLQANNYKFYVYINYSCFMGLVIHFLFIFMFALIGLKSLAIFNIVSTIMWAFSVHFNLKGYLKTGVILGNSELILHAWLCTWIIGWNTGFHYYILFMPVVYFLSPWSVTDKIVGSCINLIIYILLNHYFQTDTPLISIDPVLTIVVKYLNIATFCYMLAYFAFYYRDSVIEVEAKLELEHQKTNEALIKQNEILTQLNEELTEAAEYVKSSLPKPINEGPVNTDWRFFPSTSLGGDAFGYHWIDEEHFAIYLLDVSGHGVRAALLSVSVMNALRSQTLPNTDFQDPGQVLRSLNLSFPSESNKDMFFTMWYGVYTPNSRELTYASGGHPPALLFSGNHLRNAKNQLLRTPNYIIGGLSESTYTTKKCHVDKNSSLYIFSDGVYEVEKTDGSMWRFQEFKDYLHKIRGDNHLVLDRLYSYVRKLGKTGILEDDFTILEVVFD